MSHSTSFKDGSIVATRVVKDVEFLTCTCKSFTVRQYCAHVRFVILNREDPRKVDGGLGIFTVVPVLTDKSRSTMNVTFRVRDESEPLLTVTILPTIDTIGFVTNPFYRQDLRILFLEWITGVVDYKLADGGDLFYCKSKHHAYPDVPVLDQATWAATYDSDKKLVQLYIRDAWSFLTEGHCSTCAEIGNILI